MLNLSRRALSPEGLQNRYPLQNLSNLKLIIKFFFLKGYPGKASLLEERFARGKKKAEEPQ